MRFRANDSLTEQIAQHLGNQIILGLMQPGERIQELRIASELDVSRGSVREALLILQRRHLVSIYPRRGAVVASISARDVHDFFGLWFLLLDTVVVNMARQWQNDDLARFFELLGQLENSRRHNDIPGFYQQGVAFLEALYGFAGNHYIESTLRDLLPLTQRCLYAILRAGSPQVERTYAFLEELLKTIIARDITKLKELLGQFGADYSRLAAASAEALAGVS
ncbi:MAG: GntR family transcriptional regulator [Pseudogulbenkiania sp.]|nr:GntR family transcriptional regulator [Pseudogulbenkiania sp.]